jgi:hypothetical protein
VAVHLLSILWKYSVRPNATPPAILSSVQFSYCRLRPFNQAIRDHDAASCDNTFPGRSFYSVRIRKDKPVIAGKGKGMGGRALFILIPLSNTARLMSAEAQIRVSVQFFCSFVVIVESVNGRLVEGRARSGTPYSKRTELIDSGRRQKCRLRRLRRIGSHGWIRNLHLVR